MEDFESALERAALIWWTWTWRILLLATLAGAAFGFVIGFAAAAMGLRHSYALSLALGGLAGLIVGVWALTRVLKNIYFGFQIAVIQGEDLLR